MFGRFFFSWYKMSKISLEKQNWILKPMYELRGGERSSLLYKSWPKCMLWRVASTFLIATVVLPPEICAPHVMPFFVRTKLKNYNVKQTFVKI